MKKIATITSAAALIAAGCLTSSLVPVDSARADSTAMTSVRLTEAQIEAAVAEARALGAVTNERLNSDGSQSVTIADGSGHSMDLATGGRHVDLSGGTDTYGFWVGFNSFDQQAVIGLCFLGPAVCVVANVAVLLAATAVTNNEGAKCGSKSLRVYPVSGHKPRCA